MVGLELQRAVDLFIKMPTEEFLARLVKSKAAGASLVVVGDSEEKGPEAISRSIPVVSDAIGVGNSESAVVLSKEKDKKRHREGGSSRGHHSKKFKEPVVCPSFVDPPKVGSESFGRVATDPGLSGGRSGGDLRVCKNYVDQVTSLLFSSSCLFPFLFVSYC